MVGRQSSAWARAISGRRVNLGAGNAAAQPILLHHDRAQLFRNNLNSLWIETVACAMLLVCLRAMASSGRESGESCHTSGPISLTPVCPYCHRLAHLLCSMPSIHLSAIVVCLEVTNSLCSLSLMSLIVGVS
jgi:hypothetical protein